MCLATAAIQEASQKTVNQSAAHEHIWSCTMVIQQPFGQTGKSFRISRARNREILCHPCYVIRYESLRWTVTLGLGERRALESNWKITKVLHIKLEIHCWCAPHGKLRDSSKRWWRTPKEVPRRRIQNPFGEDDSSFQQGVESEKKWQFEETIEIKNRMGCAWSAFAKHREELTSKSHLLRQRLRWFKSAVTPVITCGAATWTTTQEHNSYKNFSRQDAQAHHSNEEKTKPMAK